MSSTAATTSRGCSFPARCWAPRTTPPSGCWRFCACCGANTAFCGYIHAKAIPGTSPELLQQLGYLADRLSVNVELPSERSLNLLAPDKGRHSIFRPMKQIAVAGAASREELALYRHAPSLPRRAEHPDDRGASPETDYHILKLTEGMYQKYSLKRVFYSAYIPVAEDTRLPALDTAAPAAGAPAVSGRLAAAVLPVQGDEILDEGQPELQPLPGPKMQLGRAALRAFSGGCEPRAL